jgi:type I restriction enzyme S subunit
MSTVPTNWAIAAGSDLFSLVRGVSYNKTDASDLPGDGLVPIFRANNISDGQIVTDDLVYVPSRYVSPEQFLRDGDLLIAASSGSRTVVGKAARATHLHLRFAFGAFCTVARSWVNEHSPWLSCYMKTKAYRKYVERVALGININNLRGSDLAAMPIKIAPLPEQRRIVAKIEGLSAKSRRARDHLDHIARLVEKYRQAILASAFRGVLTQTWRTTTGARETPTERLACLLEERESLRSSVSQRGRASVDAGRIPVDLGRLPDGWAITNLERITDPNRLIQYGILMPGPDIDGGIPYVKVLNIRGGRVELARIRRTSPEIHKQYRRSSVRKGDILLTIRGTVGRLAIVPEELDGGNITQDTVRINVLGNVFREFVFWFLSSPAAQAYFQANQKGVAVRGINVGDVRLLEVPLPSRQEQQEIVRRIEASLGWVERLASEATSARKLIDQLDQAVLAKAFQGELVPQDPNDEPASVLLERIRAERAAAPSGAKRGFTRQEKHRSRAK